MKINLIEELERKFKNKVFYWNKSDKVWQNVLDPRDRMTDDEYEAICNTLIMLKCCSPLP